MGGDLDWLYAMEYRESLRRRVRVAYRAAYTVLKREHDEGMEALEQQRKLEQQERKEPASEEDFDLTKELIYYEESRWMEQTEALAAMALALLAPVTKAFLNEQKRRMNKTHPPDPNGYPGKSELLKQVAEYKARFNIDLEKIDGFETVREVELARNCCLHHGGVPTEDYKTQTRQRLLNDMENISLTPERLDSLIIDLEQFVDSVSDQIRELRKKS